MARGRQIFVWSLLLSLGAHLLLAGNLPHWWGTPAEEIAFPIQAQLLAPPAPPEQPAPPPPAQPVQPAPAASAPAAANPEPVPAALPHPPLAPAIESGMPPSSPPPTPEPVAAAPLEPPTPAAAAAASAAASAAAEPAEPAQPPAPPPRALRSLPERLTLRYGVQLGSEGFNAGRSVYTWQARDGRYSLASSTEATGITALFVSGKILQTSEGLITATGLRPEQFWMVRGSKEQPAVRLDWAAGRLWLPRASVELPPLTQDLLSFAFHLAMTVGDDDGVWRVPVTNGRKLREYDFRVVGRETLKRGEIDSDTLHLQGGRGDEGRLDVWLAREHHWLPARIRTLDHKGKTLVLDLEAID